MLIYHKAYRDGVPTGNLPYLSDEILSSVFPDCSFSYDSEFRNGFYNVVIRVFRDSRLLVKIKTDCNGAILRFLYPDHDVSVRKTCEKLKRMCVHHEFNDLMRNRWNKQTNTPISRYAEEHDIPVADMTDFVSTRANLQFLVNTLRFADGDSTFNYIFCDCKAEKFHILHDGLYEVFSKNQSSGSIRYFLSNYDNHLVTFNASSCYYFFRDTEVILHLEFDASVLFALNETYYDSWETFVKTGEIYFTKYKPIHKLKYLQYRFEESIENLKHKNKKLFNFYAKEMMTYLRECCYTITHPLKIDSAKFEAIYDSLDVESRKRIDKLFVDHESYCISHLNCIRALRFYTSKHNFQNIPVKRHSCVCDVMEAFIPRKPGYHFVSVDLKSADIVGFALMAGSKSLLDKIADQEDIYLDLARQFFKNKTEIGENERSFAKACFLSYCNSMNCFALSEAVNDFFGKNKEKLFPRCYHFWQIINQTYPELEKHKNETWKSVKVRHYVDGLLGIKFPIMIDDSKGKKPKCKVKKAQNRALNLPKQSATSLIIVSLTYQILRLCSFKKIDVQIVVNRHDEVIFEVPNKYGNRFKSIVKKASQKTGILPKISYELVEGPTLKDIFENK